MSGGRDHIVECFGREESRLASWTGKEMGEHLTRTKDKLLHVDKTIEP
jgi:hypothetical protein